MNLSDQSGRAAIFLAIESNNLETVNNDAISCLY